MPRKPDPNSPYRIAIHVDKGYRYASTQPATVDPATGKRTYRRIHWGTVDDNNKFVPGKAYIFASLEERSKLIFPEDVNQAVLPKRGRTRTASTVIFGFWSRLQKLLVSARIC